VSTEHFSDAELTCKCGCGFLPPQSEQDRLERLRVAYARPMRVTSGGRCPDHNEKVSGTGRTGPHTKAAFDIEVGRGNAFDLMVLAPQFGFTGIGFKQKGVIRFVHLDALPNEIGQPRPTIWSY
jgi:hypothetical protein